WVTTGPKTRKFEAEFAAAVGAKHAIAVNSCTAAMHLALEAIGLGRGDEVITTPYTFAATAEVIRYFDARPVLVDVDADSLNMRPDALAASTSTDRKSTRLNSSHVAISYAVFCLKKKIIAYSNGTDIQLPDIL